MNAKQRWIGLGLILASYLSIEHLDSTSQTCDFNIVLNQAFAYQIDQESGEYIELDRHVAHRDSLVVLESENACFDEVDPSTVTLEVKSNDESTLYSPHKIEGEKILFELHQEQVDVGSLQLQAQVGDIKQQEEMEIVETAPLSLLLVPMRTRCDTMDCEVSITNELLQTWQDEVTKRFPLAQNGLSLEVYDCLDVTEDIDDLNTWFGRLQIWSSLKEIRETSGCDGLLALSPEPMDLNDQKGALSGFTFGDFTTVILMQEEKTAITIAHEVSHFYEVGDEYAGGQCNPLVNMPPYLMSGRDLLHPSRVVMGQSPYVLGGRNDETQGSGTLISESQLPYDVVEHEIITHPMSSYMGKDGYPLTEYWTTPAIWNHLIKSWQIEP